MKKAIKLMKSLQVVTIYLHIHKKLSNMYDVHIQELGENVVQSLISS